MDHVIVDSRTRFSFQGADYIILENCIFGSPVTISDRSYNIELRNCEFRDVFRFNSNSDLLIESCTFDSAVHISIPNNYLQTVELSDNHLRNGFNLECAPELTIEMDHSIIKGRTTLRSGENTTLNLHKIHSRLTQNLTGNREPCLIDISRINFSPE